MTKKQEGDRIAVKPKSVPTTVSISQWTGKWGWNGILKVGSNSGFILSRFWTRVHEILELPFVLSNMPLPDCLCRVSFRRYSLLSLEVVEKRTNVNFCGPQFFGKDIPDFSMADSCA